MALALNDFRALCAFVSTAELQEALQAVPELSAVVGAGPTAAIMAASEGDKEVGACLRAMPALAPFGTRGCSWACLPGSTACRVTVSSKSLPLPKLDCFPGLSELVAAL